MFYHNQNLIMSAQVNQATSRFMSEHTLDARSMRNSLLSVVKYVNNHLFFQDNFLEVAVSQDLAMLATKYFIDFSQTANQLVANPILDDASFMHAYPHIS